MSPLVCEMTPRRAPPLNGDRLDCSPVEASKERAHAGQRRKALRQALKETEPLKA